MAKKAQSTLVNMLLSLTAIALVAAAALAALNGVTEEPIAQAQQAKVEEAISAVLPAYDKLEIRDIDAFTSDDSVACTCLPHFDPRRRDPASPNMFCCESTRNTRGKMKMEEAHIANVHISDIVTDARAEVAHGIILLAALGGQVHHVSIDNVRELGRGMERESVVKVFTGYGDGYRAGDLHHIRVNNVTSEKARAAFQCNTHVADVRVNKIIQHAAGHSALRPKLRIAALDAKYIEDIAFSNVEGGVVNNCGR